MVRSAYRACPPAVCRGCSGGLSRRFQRCAYRFGHLSDKSYADNALLQSESRARFACLIEQGWTDAIRTLHPDQPMYTFWDYDRKRWERDAKLRIDHLLLSADLRRRLVDAGVDKRVRGEDGASDHAPAWLVLSDRPRRAFPSRKGK